MAPGAILPISDVKLKTLDAETVAITVSGKARPDGSLYNSNDEPKKYSTGMLYESLMVRQWDKYVTRYRNSLWHGILLKKKPHITESEGRYSLGRLTNVLKGSNLESPIPPFGGQDNFDVGTKGLVFVAKDPHLNPSTNTKCNFYFIAINVSSQGTTYSKPAKVEVEGLEGASTSPMLSPDGNAAVFLQMKENGYDADKNRIVLVLSLMETSSSLELLKSNDEHGLWDISPSSIGWSNDGTILFLLAEDKGTSRLFKLNVPREPVVDLPTPLTPQTGYVSDVRPLGVDSSRLFLSGSSLVDNSVYSVLSTSSAEVRIVSSNSHNGSYFGLSHDQVSEIWFQGSSDQVYAWVFRPSNFSAECTYPLAYLIHGGP